MNDFERTIAQLFPCKCGLGPFLHDASCQSLKVPYIQKKLDEQDGEIARLKAEVERLEAELAAIWFSGTAVNPERELMRKCGLEFQDRIADLERQLGETKQDAAFYYKELERESNGVAELITDLRDQLAAAKGLEAEIARLKGQVEELKSIRQLLIKSLCKAMGHTKEDIVLAPFTLACEHAANIAVLRGKDTPRQD